MHKLVRSYFNNTYVLFLTEMREIPVAILALSRVSMQTIVCRNRAMTAAAQAGQVDSTIRALGKWISLALQLLNLAISPI